VGEIYVQGWTRYSVDCKEGREIEPEGDRQRERDRGIDRRRYVHRMGKR
jgi:hypothetical protein